MKIWTYNLGQWEKDNFDIPDWTDEDKDDEMWLKKTGFSYNSRIEYGKEFQEHIYIYPNLEHSKWLAYIPSDEGCFYFIIPDMPSFIIFKKEYKDFFSTKKSKFLEIDDEIIINMDLITVIKTESYKDRVVVKFFKDSEYDTYWTKTFRSYKENGKSKYHIIPNDWLERNVNVELFPF